jgi:hypothetical protein
MLKNFLRTTVFATTLALAGGALMTPAFAEVVYNRGAAADPESLDPHKTSTTYEANILRDLFEGLVAQDAKAESDSRRRRKLDCLRRRQDLHLQAARTPPGRTALARSPLTISSIRGAAWSIRPPPPNTPPCSIRRAERRRDQHRQDEARRSSA